MRIKKCTVLLLAMTLLMAFPLGSSAADTMDAELYRTSCEAADVVTSNAQTGIYLDGSNSAIYNDNGNSVVKIGPSASLYGHGFVYAPGVGDGQAISYRIKLAKVTAPVSTQAASKAVILRAFNASGAHMFGVNLWANLEKEGDASFPITVAAEGGSRYKNIGISTTVDGCDWFDVKFVLHYQTHSFDFYVNGTLIDTYTEFIANWSGETITRACFTDRTAGQEIYFDDFAVTKPVALNGSAAIEETITAAVGSSVTLPAVVGGKTVAGWEKTAVDTSKTGRRLVNGVTEDGTLIHLTIGVGTAEERLALSSSCDASTNDKAQEGIFIHDNEVSNKSIVDDGTGNMVVQVAGNPAAGYYTSGFNYPAGIAGNSAVSFRIKFNTLPTVDGSAYFEIRAMNTSGGYLCSLYFYHTGYTAATGARTFRIGVNSKDNTSINWSAIKRIDHLVAAGDNGTGWFDVKLVFDRTAGNFDVLINNSEQISDAPIYQNKTDALGRIGFTTSPGRETSAWLDDFKLYDSSVVYPTGALPQNKLILLGKDGANAGQIALSMSDGSAQDFAYTVNWVDTAKLGITNTTAAVEGFDEGMNVTAKVCNYHIDSIVYRSFGGETVTAPSAGGTVSTANVINQTGVSGGTAIFVWYNNEGEMKTLKPVALPAESGAADVAMPLPSDEADVLGGMLKVFIVNNLDAMQPLDIVTVETQTPAGAPALFVAGDSTGADYSGTANYPMTGIGQAIGNYLDGAVTVKNLAKSGSSTSSFIAEGLWDKIMKEVKVGDYILISFGHNDQAGTNMVNEADYKANLEKFAAEAKSKGANVIMYTPVARRLEGLAGTAYNAFNTAKHMESMKAVCAANGFPLIDMTQMSTDYLQSIGEAASTKLYMVDLINNSDSYSGPEWEASRFNPNGSVKNEDYKNDNTHFTRYGANVYAHMLAGAIKDAGLGLSQYVSDAQPPAYPAV